MKGIDVKYAESIIKELQVTEKSTYLSQMENKYLLKVAPTANKIEIRQAVEKLFNVKVTNVNTMNYSGKTKRDRSMRGMGRRADWKRAVVTLKEGDTIDLT